LNLEIIYRRVLKITSISFSAKMNSSIKFCQCIVGGLFCIIFKLSFFGVTEYFKVDSNFQIPLLAVFREISCFWLFFVLQVPRYNCVLNPIYSFQVYFFVLRASLAMASFDHLILFQYQLLLYSALSILLVWTRVISCFLSFNSFLIFVLFLMLHLWYFALTVQCWQNWTWWAC